MFVYLFDSSADWRENADVDGGRRNRGIISLSIFAGSQMTTLVELETIKNVSLNGQIHNSQSINKEIKIIWLIESAEKSSTNNN